jgi:hypothetical protein
MVSGTELKGIEKIINFFQIQFFWSYNLRSMNMYEQPKFSPDISRYVARFAAGGPQALGGNVVPNLFSDSKTSTKAVDL